MSKELENIEKSILQLYLYNPELAKEELAAAGINLESLLDEGMSIIKQHQFKIEVEKNRKNIHELFSKAKSLLSNLINRDREEALSILATYQVRVQYRNLEKFSDQELNDILNDVDLIKLVEELEKKSQQGGE